MSNRHAPGCNCGNYIRLRRLENTLRRRAREGGLPADPIAKAPQVAATLPEQLAALALYFDLPRDPRRLPAAWPMSKAAAFGRNDRTRRAKR